MAYVVWSKSLYHVGACHPVLKNPELVKVFTACGVDGYKESRAVRLTKDPPGEGRLCFRCSQMRKKQQALQAKLEAVVRDL